jgi:hypothetical protein
MLQKLLNKIVRYAQRYDAVKLADSRPQTGRIGEPVVRINMSNAINGRVLEIATQSSQRHDWDVEMYIVTEGESLHDAIATILLAKGMK